MEKYEESKDYQRTTRRMMSIRNTSGCTGVYFNKIRKKWRATIKVPGHKTFMLGEFVDKQDAINARLMAEEKFFKQ